MKRKPPKPPQPSQPSPAAYVVSPDTVRMLELGHPWVIADAHTRRWPAGRSGEVVELVDAERRFLATALLAPGERTVARILDRQPIRLEAGWLSRRLEQALALRRRHADLGDTTAYRLVNAEGDGVPGVTVDRYGEHLMVQLFTESWRPHLPLLVRCLEQLLAPAGIYEKFRPQQTRELEAQSRKFSRLLAGRPAPQLLAVRESGLEFLVDLERGLDTGLFLDQRRNRRELLPRLQGKSFLNLFSYTGAFSVAAAASGAARIVSVDISAAYQNRARDNFRRNGFDPDRHQFPVADCFKALAEWPKGERFEVILMDPPSFSTTGKSRFTTRGGTAELVALALPLLVPGGLLVTSSNHQKVDLDEYLKELRRGALRAGSELRVIHTAGQPEDFPYPVTFPEGRYLKFVLAVKDGE